jgi:valyl-tRNA synthetase
VPLAEEWVEGARNFANKLWNLGRFVLSSVPAGIKPEDLPAAAERSLADRWLLSRLERTRAAATAAYDHYDPAEAARLLHAFAWSELADWAVELAKPRLAADGEDARRAGAVLAYALDVTLRLLHPVMPFVTDELGRALRDVDTITLGPWPAERPDDLDERAEAGMADLQEVIAAVRRFRAEHGVPPSRHPRLRIVPADRRQGDLLGAEDDNLRRLARLEAAEIGPAGWAGDAGDGEGPTAKLLAAGAELYLPLAGLLDLDEERARLARERDALEAETRRAEAKLANADFVAKAPAAVVEKARERLAEAERARAKVVEQIQELTATTGG